MPQEKINIKSILRFAELLNQFQAVERVVLVKNSKRWENDVEHSYMLTMLADYIISSGGYKLNRQKVMMYALVHDLVESYAGDTYILSKDAAHVASKHKREADALTRIIKEFPEYKDLGKHILTYEKKSDDESKFVYALDKIQPVIQIYLEGGRTWRKMDMSFQDLMDHKNEKVTLSPIVEKYWKEFVKILEKNKNKLFPN